MITIDLERKNKEITLTNRQNIAIEVSNFDPSELLAGALAKCTEGTVRNFAQKKELPLKDLSVRVEYDRDRETKTAYFKVYLDLMGDLSEKDLKKLYKVAEKSYIRRVLSQDIHLEGHMLFEGREILPSH